MTDTDQESARNSPGYQIIERLKMHLYVKLGIPFKGYDDPEMDPFVSRTVFRSDNMLSVGKVVDALEELHQVLDGYSPPKRCPSEEFNPAQEYLRRFPDAAKPGHKFIQTEVEWYLAEPNAVLSDDRQYLVAALRLELHRTFGFSFVEYPGINDARSNPFFNIDFDDPVHQEKGVAVNRIIRRLGDDMCRLGVTERDPTDGYCPSFAHIAEQTTQDIDSYLLRHMRTQMKQAKPRPKRLDR